MCLGSSCLFACLLAFPSLPYFRVSIHSTHWFLSVMCEQVPGRWTVARLPSDLLAAVTFTVPTFQ